MQAIPIDWHDISTVFLDMDGTLLDLHFDNHFWLQHVPLRYAEKQGIPLEQASAELTTKTSAIEGTLDWYCLDYWEETLDMDIVGIKHEVADRIAIRDNVIEFLEFLQERQKRIVLLTNAHRKTLEFKFMYVKLAQFFDRIITSHDLGLAKEQPGFWQKMHQIEDFSNDASLFIDDNMAVLNAAREHGIKYLFTISQPDSQQQTKASDAYIAIDNFSQLTT